MAKAYLEHLYSDEGQEIFARHYYRPSSEAIARKYAERFPKVELFTLTHNLQDILIAGSEAFTQLLVGLLPVRTTG